MKPATSLLRRLFPSWPVPPPALWLTGAAGLGCLLCLCFGRELWTDPKPAERWLFTAWCLLMLAAIGQTLHLLWRWLAAYPGPRWMALLLRLGLLGATVAAVLPGIVLLALAVFSFFKPVLNF
ncbi:hypothetical protein Q5H93_17500 [Hymenobacter sp. ASUV-10]|uniref:Uncharacterized protein n=1 Tax=Hymenobacter aranciens TaxID=3063996 RepID=A0ABT9BE49_9BACT|nr:hypothetical protein [Hymenobacter sp. ASUV-10]MDO7876544.1 hypothetical protein [Hymenobacter sp. ASUV-10]